MLYRKLDKLTPRFKEKVELFIKELDSTIFVTESFRTKARQLELYAQGRTKPWRIVTWTRDKSKHLIGEAIDIAFLGGVLYPRELSKWQKVWSIAKKYWINWAYTLWKTDKPHFQDNWKELYPKIYKGIEVKLWDSKVSNAWYNHKEQIIYLYPKFFSKSKLKQEAILKHEYAHHILRNVAPKKYMWIWKQISEFNPKVVKKINRVLKTNYLENIYITKYAEKNFLEDFSETIEESYLNKKTGAKTQYKWYLGFKVKIANMIYNRFAIN